MIYIAIAIIAILAGLFGPIIFIDKEEKFIRLLVRGVCLVVAVISFGATSWVNIDSDSVGLMKRKYLGSSMPNNRVIATGIQMGPLAEVLPPGFQIKPFINIIFDVEEQPLTEIPPGHYGQIYARDGNPLPDGMVVAPAWPENKVQQMIDAEYFLGEGKGYAGLQLTVLPPGKYRLNTYLFEVKPQKATIIQAGFVGVVKSQIQELPFDPEIAHGTVVPKGHRGVWDEVILPGTYFLNTEAYEVIPIDTRKLIWVYKGGYTKSEVVLSTEDGEIKETLTQMEIPIPEDAAAEAVNVRVEGYNIPVELRMIVQITPEDAPYIVANVGTVQDVEDRVITPIVRSEIRNVAGKTGRAALEFMDNRSILEQEISEAIQKSAKDSFVKIVDIRLGEPAMPPALLSPILRKQFATSLIETFSQEQIAQEKRVEAENTKALADQQGDLVTAEIEKQKAALKAEAAKLQGEGERDKLKAIAEGQQAQVDVLGAQLTYQLTLMDQVLAAAVENDQIVKVPLNYIVTEGGASSLEGMAAIFNSAPFMKGVLSNTGSVGSIPEKALMPQK